MRIDGTSRTQTSAYRGMQRAESGAIFQAESQVPETSVAGTGQFGPITGIDVLLALQSVEDPRLARRKAVRRGQSLLDALEDVKLDLLLGGVSEGRLDQLLALIGQTRGRSLPDLDSVLDEVELRVRVELAKFGR
ncbi:MAG: flagellar assembly protein FliX [Devosia sp.]|nr:flagellar assembly protein FliX [Devosia sp.]